MTKFLGYFASCALFASLAVLPQTKSSAEAPVVAEGHSTVKIVFAYEQKIVATGLMGGMGGGGMGGIGAGASPANPAPEKRLRVGDSLIPPSALQEVKITINDQSVGSALLGMYGDTPSFVLKEGKYRFQFTSKDFGAVTQTIHIVGTGSRQIMFVRLKKSGKEEPNTATNSQRKSAAESPHSP